MSMELVERAMTDLFSAMDKYENSNRQIIQTVSQQTEKMTQINQQVGQRLGIQGGSAAGQATLPTSSAAKGFLE
ncbi:hypothetical protein D3C84_1211200 [compost metagenome]